ncbi:MAG: DM13 domain-containing protein [Fulvivirga sp.]
MLRKLSIILLSAAFVMGCSDDDDPVVIDPTQPSGTFRASASGSFVDQSMAGTTGSVSIGTDSDGVQFLQYSSDFSTNLNTGTVSVYLTSSMVNDADEFAALASPGTGNPDLKLVGPLSGTGMSFQKLNSAATANQKFVLLWCGSVGVPFGSAELN